MSIHVRTGNRLDVVEEIVNGQHKIIGLQRLGSDEVIPLPDPEGLLEVLKREIRRYNPEFCVFCGAGIGKFRREGEGTCPKCNPEGVKKNEALAGRHQKPR